MNYMKCVIRTSSTLHMLIELGPVIVRGPIQTSNDEECDPLSRNCFRLFWLLSEIHSSMVQETGIL